VTDPTNSATGDPLDLSGRLVVISGAAGALGEVIVATLLARRAQVVSLDVLDSWSPNVDSVQPDQHLYLQCDTADPEAVGAAFGRVTTQFGRLPDAVCCHAGLVASHPIPDFPLSEFDALVRVNLRGPWVLAAEAARRWIDASFPGHLLFTSSWVQDVPWPGIAPYNATKAAVRSLAQSFARELAPHGIRSNAVAPGIVAAGMAKRQFDEEPDYRARALRAIPLGYQQPPQSVADAFLFLLSPLASYMTGSVLVVDGGCSLYPMD
jgi:NAD(P)-dependent dehydrogenase (short-subunit alcohol dehydrogenase family)